MTHDYIDFEKISDTAEQMATETEKNADKKPSFEKMQMMFALTGFVAGAGIAAFTTTISAIPFAVVDWATHLNLGKAISHTAQSWPISYACTGGVGALMGAYKCYTNADLFIEQLERDKKLKSEGRKKGKNVLGDALATTLLKSTLLTAFVASSGIYIHHLPKYDLFDNAQADKKMAAPVTSARKTNPATTYVMGE